MAPGPKAFFPEQVTFLNTFVLGHCLLGIRLLLLSWSDLLCP